MDRVCSKCGTTNTKKWYNYENGFICQKDYRRLRYEARQSELISYQRNYYQKNKDKLLFDANEKYRKSKDPRCHQKIIRDSKLDSDLNILGKDILNKRIDSYQLNQVKFSSQHRTFIETYEWLGTVGNSPRWTFEATCDGHLAAVILFNEPSNYSRNIIGRDTKKMECLIQRGACASWAHPHLGSKLIMFACRWLTQNTTKRIFTAYSDPRANEIGTIYQACNFDYLGDSYGARFKYKHHTFNQGKAFSAQTLRRTSTLKKFLKQEGVSWDIAWQKENGFKDLSKLPIAIKDKWYRWGLQILNESKKIKLPKKGKYVLVVGKDRREQRQFNREKVYQKKNYPKRTKCN